MRVAYTRPGADGLLYRDMTSAEIAEWEKLQEETQPTEPTIDDRVTALENQIPAMSQAVTQLSELDTAYREGVNSV